MSLVNNETVLSPQFVPLLTHSQIEYVLFRAFCEIKAIKTFVTKKNYLNNVKNLSYILLFHSHCILYAFDFISHSVFIKLFTTTLFYFIFSRKPINITYIHTYISTKRTLKNLKFFLYKFISF